MRFELIIIFLLCLIICGCNKTIHRLNIVCFVDYSGSLTRETLEHYVNIISSNVFMNLQENDRLVVLPIDEGSKKEPVKIVFEDLYNEKNKFKVKHSIAHLKEIKLKKIQDYKNEKVLKIHDELIRQKDLRERFTNYTDILSALEQTKSLIETKTEVPNSANLLEKVEKFLSTNDVITSENIICIFSDMILETEKYNFSNPTGVSDEEKEKIIKDLLENNKMPNLNGCKIFITGRTGKTNTQIDNIQNFWKNYFLKAGAQLINDDYDNGGQITNSIINTGV